MPAEPAKRQAGRALSLAPGLVQLLSYNPRWLPKDLVAGLVLTALLVPQGMAYAELAGLPAITGLYTSILCLWGTRSSGPSGSSCSARTPRSGPMIAATILPLVGAGRGPGSARSRSPRRWR